MPLLGKHLIPSAHICMVPWLGTSVTGLCQISKLCGIDASDECFRLTYATHTRFLPFIMCISSATDQIYGRFLKLCQVMEHSENDRVNYLTYLCMSSARSIISSHLRIVGKRLHLDDKRKLLYEGSQLLKQAYINE